MVIEIPESINGPEDNTSEVDGIDFAFADVDTAYRVGRKDPAVEREIAADEVAAPMKKSFPVENTSAVEEPQPYTGTAYTAGVDLSHTGSSVDFGQRPKLLGSVDDEVYHYGDVAASQGDRRSSISEEMRELQDAVAHAGDFDDIGFSDEDALTYEADDDDSTSGSGSTTGGDSTTGSNSENVGHGDGIDLESVERKPLPGMSAASVREESAPDDTRVEKKQVGVSSSTQATTQSTGSAVEKTDMAKPAQTDKPSSIKVSEEQAIKNLRADAKQHRAAYQNAVRSEQLFGHGLTPAERKKRITNSHNSYAANMVRSCLTPLTQSNSLASGIIGAVGMSVMLWCISPKFRSEVGSHLPNIKGSINESANNISNAIASKGFWGNAAAHQRAKQAAVDFKDNLAARIKDTLGGRLAMSEESAVMTRVAVAENAYNAMREEGADPKVIMAEYKETVADLEREWVDQKFDLQDINAGARRLVGERVRKDPSYAAMFDNTAYGHFTPTAPVMRSFKDEEYGMVVKPVYDGGWENSEGHKIVKKSTFFTPREPIVGDKIKDHALFTADVIRKDLIKVIDNGNVEDLKNAVVGYFAAENVYKTHRDELAMCRHSSPIAHASGRIHGMLDAARSDGLTDEEISTLSGEAINNALGCVGKEGDKYMKAMEKFDTTYGTTWYTEDVAQYSKDPLGYVTAFNPEVVDDLMIAQGKAPAEKTEKSAIVEVVVDDDKSDQRTSAHSAATHVTGVQPQVDESYSIDTSQLTQATAPAVSEVPETAQSADPTVDDLVGDDPTLQAQAISLTQSGGLSASYGGKSIIDASHSAPIPSTVSTSGQYGFMTQQGPQPGMGDGHIGSAAQINVREPYAGSPQVEPQPYTPGDEGPFAQRLADQYVDKSDERKDADSQGPDNTVAVNYDTEQKSRPDVQRQDFLEKDGFIESLSQLGEDESAQTLSRDSNKLSTSEKTARKIIRMRHNEALELEDRLKEAEPGSAEYKEVSERLAEISEVTPCEFDTEVQGAIQAVQTGQIDYYQPQGREPEMDY